MLDFILEKYNITDEISDSTRKYIENINDVEVLRDDEISAKTELTKVFDYNGWGRVTDLPLALRIKNKNLLYPDANVIYTPTNDLIPALNGNDLEEQATLISIIYNIETPIILAEDEFIYDCVLAINGEKDDTKEIIILGIDDIKEFFKKLEPLKPNIFFDINTLNNHDTCIVINSAKLKKLNIMQINTAFNFISNKIMQFEKIKTVNLKSLNIEFSKNDISVSSAAFDSQFKILNDTEIESKIISLLNKEKQTTPVEICKKIKKLVYKLSNRPSANVYKYTIPSFKKPNRRNPDDYNMMGRSITDRFIKDLHVYLDTSGSINEYRYKEAIRTLIYLAQKLNVNLIFNSFSHRLSEPTTLKLKGKSVNQIYAEFQKIPKVSGGTNFNLIWQYIKEDKKRTLDEISIMITDFEWNPPSMKITVPPNLYYAPVITVNDREWKKQKEMIARYIRNMRHIQSNIAEKILI